MNTILTGLMRGYSLLHHDTILCSCSIIYLRTAASTYFPSHIAMFVLNIMEAIAENAPRGQFFLFTGNKSKGYRSIAMEVNAVSNKDSRETTHSRLWSYISYNANKRWYIGQELWNGSVVVQLKCFHKIHMMRLHIQSNYKWFGWQEIGVLSKLL
jgi:hypothetical protein